MIKESLFLEFAPSKLVDKLCIAHNLDYIMNYESKCGNITSSIKIMSLVYE